MKLMLDIKDNKANPLSNYKANVLEGIKESIKDVKLIRQGRLKGTPAKDLLNEL